MSWVARTEKAEFCMSDIEQAKSLLRLAQRDFNALLGMEHSSLFADEIFGFHAQQAGAEIEVFMDLDEFTAYAVEARYAEGDPDDANLDRAVAIRKVGALLDHVGTIITSET